MVFTDCKTMGYVFKFFQSKPEQAELQEFMASWVADMKRRRNKCSDAEVVKIISSNLHTGMGMDGIPKRIGQAALDLINQHAAEIVP